MGDTIYRQAAIDAICKVCSMEEDYHKCDGYPETSTWCDELVALRALPPAQPETKQGEWIPHSEMCTFPGTELTSSGGVMCSSCGFKTHNRMHKLIGCPYNYCPICGTSMRKENKNG